MIQTILQSLYFMLPAYVANMTPVFLRGVNLLNYPLDFNKSFRGQPLLGKNKTFRGLFFGTLFAVAMAYIQHLLQASTFHAPGIDYSNWFWLGFLLGFGALFSDTVKSFFKRRLGKKPGERFLPWDQLDFAIGALVFVSLVYVPPLAVVVISIVASFFLQIATVHVGFYLGIRKEKW
jgi:CDP-2,3-bis-(O-geranylgeranyl)-sn-glycerol synthase